MATIYHLKKTIFILFLISFHFFTNAQFKVVKEGASFDEPVKGLSKLVVMKGGSVIYFSTSESGEGLDLKIYDDTHKAKVVKTIEPTAFKFKGANLKDIFEINGDAVLLISKYENKTPVLYRVIIDGKTGALKNQEKIAEMEKIGAGTGYAMAFGNLKMPEIHTSKDPDSENYAIALFNTLESDRNKRLEIVMYGKDNKELARSYFTTKDDKYKYLEFVSMTVIGSDKTSVLVNGYNTRSSGGKSSQVILANLDKGANKVTNIELGMPQDSVLEDALVKYNPITKKLIVLAKLTAKAGSKKADVLLAQVDPYSLKLDKIQQVVLTEQVYARAREIYGKSYKFFGTPKEIYINNDGGFSAVFEEEEEVTHRNGNDYSSHIELHNIATMVFNAKNEMVNNYFIPKDYWINNDILLNHFANSYKKYSYINGKNGKNYIFINDTRRNIERIEKSKDPVQIKGVSDCDAYYFPLSGANAIPERKYLFGEPDNKSDHTLCAFGISTYDKENDLYIAFKLIKDGRNSQVSLVWLKPM